MTRDTGTAVTGQSVRMAGAPPAKSTLPRDLHISLAIAPFVVILDSMPSSDNKSKIIARNGPQRIIKASGEVKGARKGKVGRDGT
jgi:hypothetical protein